MRRFLLIFGWLSVIGSIGDGIISLYALWVVGSGGWANPGIQVGPLLEQHLPALYWVKDVARYVLPASVVTWVFNLPALVYFPVRVVMGCVIGWWVLAKAKSMGSSKSNASCFTTFPSGRLPIQTGRMTSGLESCIAPRATQTAKPI